MDETEDREREEDKESVKGSGKATGSGSGGIRLPPNKLKEVMSNWEQLDAVQAVARVAEFFSEFPTRASAHIAVSFVVIKEAAKEVKSLGFAIMHNFLELGNDLSDWARDPGREATRDRLRRRIGFVPSTIPGVTG